MLAFPVLDVLRGYVEVKLATSQALGAESRQVGWLSIIGITTIVIIIGEGLRRHRGLDGTLYLCGICSVQDEDVSLMVEVGRIESKRSRLVAIANEF